MEAMKIKKEICALSAKDEMTLKDIETLYYLVWIYNGVKDWKTGDEDYIKMTPELAKKWVSNMKNSDGTMGEHWSFESVDEIRKSRGMADVSTAVCYAVMNMLYSDYGSVMSKYGIGDMTSMWADLTEAWIYDKDAKRNKTSLYYEFIVCK